MPDWTRLPGSCETDVRSTSFAHPADVIAGMFSNTFAGIAPGAVAVFIAMQMAGAALAYRRIRVLFPTVPAVPIAAAATAREAVS
jgi:hypothetical protein